MDGILDQLPLDEKKRYLQLATELKRGDAVISFAPITNELTTCSLCQKDKDIFYVFERINGSKEYIGILCLNIINEIISLGLV